MNISEQVKELREVANTRFVGYGAELLNKAADTIESLSDKLSAVNMERSADDNVWIECNKILPDKEVLCCDSHGEMIIGYVFENETSESGFSAENEHEYMYDCVKWMEKPKP